MSKMNLGISKDQKKLILSLVAKADEIFSAYPVEKTSLFFSFFYTVVLLKEKSKRTAFFSITNYNIETSALRLLFPHEYDLFSDMCYSMDEHQLQSIYKLLKNIVLRPSECDNTVSWLYQSLKKGLEKSAFDKIGKNRNKIQGTDLLYTTQFFTDEYMVKYLVDSCIFKHPNNIQQLTFVDPALGGGNFLTYTFVALYEWYSKNTNMQPRQIVNTIVNNQLLGYDLDMYLPVIAKLSLYINIVARIGINPIGSIPYYGGVKGDILGFIAEDIKSNINGNLTFQKHLNGILDSERQVIYITNPPFMGKRDMEPTLKEKLLNSYPKCKGDLCFSFMAKILSNLREHDTLALVSQNGWMNLSSMKEFRHEFLDNYHVISCADMGSNAFFAINGEKTNIVLAIISKIKNNNSVFYNLRNLSYADKVKYLGEKSYLTYIEYTVNQNDFRANPSYEFSYELVNSFLSLNELDTYSHYANPMQGSSTGNNKDFVKYAWETETVNDVWKLVSKGGGYSRWQGLNIYKVKWGHNGELVINNPGSAIRNLKEIPFTDLVYSDTGTLGLNVRLLLPGQIFIASGPGIRVLEGDKYCHIAFLNSKIATCLLKIKNPKFTISAGYIGKLPVKREILCSTQISKLAKLAIGCKSNILASKLPNIEFKQQDFSTIVNLNEFIDEAILSDFVNYKKIAIAENKINSLILKKYKFNETQYRLISEMIGRVPSKSAIVSVEIIDKTISTVINESCMTISQKLEGCIAGSDNVLEILSYKFNSSITSLFEIILHNVHRLYDVQRIYKTDLIHKLILKVCGIESVSCYNKTVSSKEIVAAISHEYPYLYDSLNVTQKVVEEVVNGIHYRVFFSKPILILK